MASNLPIISLTYPFFNPYSDDLGLILVSDISQIPEKLKYLQENLAHTQVHNREKVLDYSWERLSQRLGGIYSELVDNKN